VCAYPLSPCLLPNLPILFSLVTIMNINYIGILLVFSSFCQLLSQRLEYSQHLVLKLPLTRIRYLGICGKLYSE
jgi:hypothetical protein